MSRGNGASPAGDVRAREGLAAKGRPLRAIAAHIDRRMLQKSGTVVLHYHLGAVRRVGYEEEEDAESIPAEA